MRMLQDDAALLLSDASLRQFAVDFDDSDVIKAVQLFRAIRFLAQRINEYQTAHLAQFGVSATKYNYLAVLYVHRQTGVSAGDLGHYARTTSGSVTTMIKALHREGLVQRDQHPTDGRSVVLSLTPRGSRLYLKCAKLQHQFVVRALSELGWGKADRLLQLLVETGNALRVTESAKENP